MSDVELTRVCNFCHKEFSLSYFPKSHTGRMGHTSKCIYCTRESDKQRRINRTETWTRKCPVCENNIIHIDKYSYEKGIKYNKSCTFCSRQKTGENNKNNIRTQEFKDNLSKKMINHPSIKGNKKRGEKIRDKNIGRNVLSWHRGSLSIERKCLICNKEFLVQPARLNNHHFCSRGCLTEYYHNSGIWKPRFNPKACHLIDIYGEEHGYEFQHALNGGEFRIKELGYWVDGYDKIQNIVVEYYEKHHTNKTNILLDNIRKEKIINHLKCKFVIIYYNNKIEVYE